MQNLYNNGTNSPESISGIMQNLTSAISVYIRANDDPSNNAPATGPVYQTTTCIAVRWPWFALTVFLGLGAICFLAMALHNVHTKGRHLNWKSSILPYLFHGLDPDLQLSISNIERLEKMEEYARETRVQLVNTENGWLFRKVDD